MSVHATIGTWHLIAVCLGSSTGQCRLEPLDILAHGTFFTRLKFLAWTHLILWYGAADTLIQPVLYPCIPKVYRRSP